MKPNVLSAVFLAASVLFLSVPSVAQRKDHSSKHSSEANQLSMEQQDALDLARTLARSLKAESDKPSAARLQARLADVLWKFDEDLAREVFSWAFEAARQRPPDELPTAQRTAYAVRQAACIREVLTRLGSHDQKLAQAWLKMLEEEKTGKDRSLESISFRSELLIEIALQLAETNAAQAQRLGMLSLTSGRIPENFGRLLFALSRISRSQSDELFRAALMNLRRNDYAYDSALIVLINYLFSADGMLDSDAAVSDARLLANYFVDAAWRQARAGTTTALPESSASFYSLIEVRGLPIVSRYAAERLPELQGQMRDLASGLSQPQLENTARMRQMQQQQIAVSGSNTYDIDEQIDRATKEKDVQVRDALLNRIAHSLMRSNNERALEVAGKIDDAEIRSQAEDDIHLVRIQQLLVRRAYDDARKTASKLTHIVPRAKVLIELASKIFSESKDTARATELLSEASTVISKSDSVPDRIMTWLLVAQQFVRFDSIRGFQALEDAIKQVNQFQGEESTTASVLSKPRLSRIKTYTVINGNEMSPGDRSTFDAIDFSQVAPFVNNDYMQTRLLGNKIENSLRRSKFLVAVASAMLLKSSETSTKPRVQGADINTRGAVIGP